MHRVMAAAMLAVLPLGAHAQSPKLEDAWKDALKTAYFESKGEAFATLDGTVYAFGSWSRNASSLTEGTYVFLRCGGTSGYQILSTSDDQDAAQLKRMRIVNPGSPEHAKITNTYKSGCWTLAAWKTWGDELLNKAKGQFK